MIQLHTNRSGGPDCPQMGFPAGCSYAASGREGAVSLPPAEHPRGSCLSPESREGSTSFSCRPLAGHLTHHAVSFIATGPWAVPREAPHPRAAERHRAGAAPTGREKPSPSEQLLGCSPGRPALAGVGGGFPVRVQKA